MKSRNRVMPTGISAFRSVSVLVLISVSLLSAGSGPAAISKMDRTEIDARLTANAGSGLTITGRMAQWSELFLNMPYSWTATGDGPYALYENYPLINLDSTNCMVFCEHVLALSISDSWDNFFNNLQQIRYRRGIIGMRTRNHYTMADWLPENSWLLEDVSAEVGGKFTRTMTRTISHSKFFTDKGISDLRYVLPDRTLTLNYVPKNKLINIQKNLRNGDILALLFAEKDDIFSAHMMMVIEKKDGLYIRESSNSRWTTFETPYEEWAKGKGSWDRYAGIAVMRVKDELNLRDRIILPDEIPDLKNK